MRLTPYEQGNLDGFCGIYSVVNATRLIVNGMGEEEAIDLFIDCLQYVEKKKNFGEACVRGVNRKTSGKSLGRSSLLNTCGSCEKAPLQNEGVSFDDFFNVLREHFGQEGKRVAIICFYHEDWDHWTVVKAMTMKRMMLFDSCNMKILDISQCTFEKKAKWKSYCLLGTPSFLPKSRPR